MATFKLRDMCGRPVVMKRVKDSYERGHGCADCPQGAKWVIYEFPEALTNNDGHAPAKWYWCGDCCIGG